MYYLWHTPLSIRLSLIRVHDYKKPETSSIVSIESCCNRSEQHIYAFANLKRFLNKNDSLPKCHLCYFSYYQNYWICNTETRSSPQWWSGRSTTAHIVFHRRELVLGFGGSCTIVQCINAVPKNALSNVLNWRFRRPPTVLLQFERETFGPLSLGVKGKWGSG